MKGFFAFPSGEQNIHDAIHGATDLCKGTSLSIQPWQNLTVAGFRVDDSIRTEILEADLLLADVTYANHNVYYEMGYAIALGKPVLPTLNITIRHSISRLQRIGIFDTIG